MPRRWLGRLLVPAAALVLVLGWAGWAPDTTAVDAPAALRIAFEFQRAPVASTVAFPLCREGLDAGWRSAGFPECPSYMGTKPTGDARPDITSVLLTGNLDPAAGEQKDPARCTRRKTGPQFPSSQVTTTATNVAQSDMSLTVTANPAAPVAVAAGTYCGTVVVNRTQGAPVYLDMTISLADRWQPPVVFRVVSMLFLGALVGYLIKWFVDSFAGLAGAYDRRRRFLIGVRGGRSALPAAVRALLERIDDSIETSNQQQAAADLQLLAAEEARLDQIRVFAAQVTGLRQEIARQKHQLDVKKPSDRAAVAAVMHQEDAAVQEWIDAPWPPTDATAAAGERQKLIAKAQQVTAALTAMSVPATADQQKNLDAVLAQWQGAPPGAAAAAPMVPVTVPAVAAPRPRFMDWAIEHRVGVLGTVTGVVVVVLGLQTLFLADAAFNNTFTDYFTLLAWAFAGQIAGTTIAELAGKLTRPVP